MVGAQVLPLLYYSATGNVLFSHVFKPHPKLWTELTGEPVSQQSMGTARNRPASKPAQPGLGQGRQDRKPVFIFMRDKRVSKHKKEVL